jgi:hypothetical protein
VLNVFKEELPDDRESQPVPFVGAAIGFGLLLQFA